MHLYLMAALISCICLLPTDRSKTPRHCFLSYDSQFFSPVEGVEYSSQLGISFLKLAKYNMMIIQGGPLPVTNKVINPISRAMITPVPHL